MADENGIVAGNKLSDRARQIKYELLIWKNAGKLYPAEQERVRELNLELNNLKEKRNL